MAQFARPNSDVSTGTWSASGGGLLFSKIDEVSVSDSDYVYSQNSTADTLEVGLSTVTDPSTGTGHTVYFRIAIADDDNIPIAPASGGNAVTVNCRLFEGTKPIASSGATATTGSWVTQSFTLSTTAANGITDYSNLRLRFVTTDSNGDPSNDRGVAVSWAYLEVPDAVTILTADAGTVNVEGSDATFSRVVNLSAEASTISVISEDATLSIPSRDLTAESATLEVTPFDSGLKRSLSVGASAGTIEVQGADATINVEARVLTADTGTINVVDSDTGLRKIYIPLTGSEETINVVGEDATLEVAARTLTADAGIVNVVVGDALLVPENTIVTTQGLVNVVGSEATLRRSIIFTADSATLEVVDSTTELVLKYGLTAEGYVVEIRPELAAVSYSEEVRNVTSGYSPLTFILGGLSTITPAIQESSGITTIIDEKSTIDL